MSSAELPLAADGLIRGLLSVLDDVLTERDVVFLALFLREDAGGKWDLLVSSRSFEEFTTFQAVEFVVGKLRLKLGDAEFLQLSRVVIIETGDPSLHAILSGVNVKRGRIEIRDCVFSGVEVRHAIILRAAPIGVGEEAARAR